MYEMSKNDIMTKENKPKFSVISIIFTSILTIAFLIQIVMMFFIHNELDLTFLVYIGYFIWIFSIYFALIPFRVFKKRGGVEKGKSYVYTNKIVTSGTYAIVRHPQYLGGLLFTISITLWTQVLLSLILSIIIIILIYQWTYTEDKNLIRKFGEDYKRYKEKVPRLNPILGIIKYFSNKK